MRQLVSIGDIAENVSEAGWNWLGVSFGLRGASDLDC